MRACYAVLAGTLMTLALTGQLTPTYVMVIVAIMGLAMMAVAIAEFRKTE